MSKLFVFVASMMFAGLLSAESLVLQYGGVEVANGTVFDLQKDISMVYGQNFDQDNYILKEIRVLGKDKPYDGKNAYLSLSACGSYGAEKMVSGSQTSTYESSYLWTTLTSSCYSNGHYNWYLKNRGAIILQEIRVTVEKVGYSQPYPTECPYGYHWDYTYNKCVKDAPIYHECQYGYHWDYTYNKCVKDAPVYHDCPYGYTWDSYYGKCVKDAPDYDNCPWGYHWSYTLDKCIKDAAINPPHYEDHNCRPGWYWSESLKRCVKESSVHNPYNPNPNPHGVCPMGKIWSEILGKCI
jgi:hypothetical protein